MYADEKTVPQQAQVARVTNISVPPCDYRRDMVESKGGLVRYECSHPRIRGPKVFELVLPSTCRECEFCRWESDTAIDNYVPRRSWSPTTEQFAQRIKLCDVCEHRRENYCLRAGGACGLQFSLTKSSFECPVKKFGKAENIIGGVGAEPPVMAAAPLPPDDRETTDDPTATIEIEYINGAHAVADAPADDERPAAPAGQPEGEVDAAAPAGQVGPAGDGDGADVSRVAADAE